MDKRMDVSWKLGLHADYFEECKSLDISKYPVEVSSKVYNVVIQGI